MGVYPISCGVWVCPFSTNRKGACKDDDVQERQAPLPENHARKGEINSFSFFPFANTSSITFYSSPCYCYFYSAVARLTAQEKKKKEVVALKRKRAQLADGGKRAKVDS